MARLTSSTQLRLPQSQNKSQQRPAHAKGAQCPQKVEATLVLVQGINVVEAVWFIVEFIVFREEKKICIFYNKMTSYMFHICVFLKQP